MKILVVSQYFTPDITAAAFRIGETVEVARGCGHEVKVITTYPHKSQTRVESNSKNVYRTAIFPLKGGGIIRYLLHYLSFIPGSILLALKLRFKGWKPDIIWASSPPLFVGISGWLIKNIVGSPFVFDIRDIWPDTAVAAGQLSEDGSAYRIGRRLELFLYKRADHLTCVSAPMSNYLKDQASATSNTVIYNGVSADSISHNQNRTGNSSGSVKTIMYAGNLGYLQGIDVLLQALAETKAAGGLSEKWMVDLMGGGAEESYLKQLTDELNLKEVVKFRGTLPKEEVHDRLLSADLLFFSLKSHPVLEKTIPSKLFDYLITGVPIIGGIEGEGKQILHKTGSNLTFEAGNISDLTDTLKTAFIKHEELKKLGIKNIELVKKYYTREKMAHKLLSVFKEIISNKK